MKKVVCTISTTNICIQYNLLSNPQVPKPTYLYQHLFFLMGLYNFFFVNFPIVLRQLHQYQKLRSHNHILVLHFQFQVSILFFLQLSSLQDEAVQCNLIGLNKPRPSSASTQVLWNQLPTPFGVDNAIH